MMRYSDTYYNQVYLLLNYKTLQEKSQGKPGEEESLRYLSICLHQQLFTEGLRHKRGTARDRPGKSPL